MLKGPIEEASLKYTKEWKIMLKYSDDPSKPRQQGRGDMPTVKRTESVPVDYSDEVEFLNEQIKQANLQIETLNLENR